MACSLRPRSRSSRLLLATIAVATAFCLTAETPEPPAKKRVFAVVASRSVPIERISLSDVRQMFKLEKRYWKPGEPLVVLIPPYGSDTRSFVLQKVCRSDEGQLRQLILEKMYRGEIDLAPKVVASDQEAMSFVSAGRGLVAIVPAELAESGPVKVLRIDDRLPGAAGYALAE